MTKTDARPHLTQQPAWQALERHYSEIKDMQLRELFAQDTMRGEKLTAEGAGLFLDYSKNRVTDVTLKLLLQLAEQTGVAAKRDAMFAGEKINVTEDRAVLHTALRVPRGGTVMVDGVNVVPEVHGVLDKMAAFADQVRAGTWLGHTGKPIKNIVNIGIGGSDLGPVMAYEGLKFYSQRDLTVRFVSNVDGTDLVEKTLGLDPAQTLFIVSSKTFTTQETMANATSARDWLLEHPERRRGGGAAFRGRFHQRRCCGQIRHRHRQHVRLLGLGGRALQHGQRHRVIADDRRWPREFPRAARRFPRDGRAFSHRARREEPADAAGLDRAVVQRFLRRADGRRFALRSVPVTLQRLLAAARYGEQRQTRDAGRRSGGLPDRPGDLGAARHQRPARVLPADSPGHQADSLRLYRLYSDAQSLSAAPRPLDGQRIRPDRGAGLRQDPPGSRAGRREAGAGGPPGFRGQSAHQHHPGRQTDAAHPGELDRPLRAQGVRAGRRVEHQLVRSVGRGTRQGAGLQDRAGTASRGRTGLETRQQHQRADSALPGRTPGE